MVVYNTANFVVSVFVASLAFDALLGPLGVSLDQVTVGLLLAGAVAAVTFEATNLALLSVGMRVKYRRAFRAFWREEMPPFLRSLGVLLLLGLAIAALYAAAGIIAVALLFVPLFASQYMFKLLVREREHVTRQTELSDQYLEMNIGLAAAMVVLLDSKDEYTAQHSAAVAMFCRDMATALDLPEEEAEALHFAGLLHDLGKVGVPDAVLRKASSLDEGEWEFIRQHPEKGAEVLSHLAAYQEVADIVRFHHERLDGSGYPNGILSDAIPELSKVLAVADSYHAMTSDRPYRGARSSFEALKELRMMSGTTLDRSLRGGPCQGAPGQGSRLPRRQLHRLHGRVRARPHQPATARPRGGRRQRPLRVAAGRPSGRLTSARAVSAAAMAFSTSSHRNGTMPVSAAAPGVMSS